jgi:pyridoxal phosphate enzyme (YggS family)
MGSIAENVINIRRRIAAAAERSGRGADDVLLVAVTKTHTPEEMIPAIEAGCTDIGENKVQEIMDKYDIVGELSAKNEKNPNIKWHMIGHLQRNKVKYIINKVCMIHSVDSLRLAEEISRRAETAGRVMDILVQVNAAGEDSKFGTSSDEAEGLVREIAEKCGSVRVKGLMSIAPAAENPEDIRRYFREVKQIYDRIAADGAAGGADFSILSMGMTGDYEVAVEEGSTLVRVGTGIFGSRNYSSKL